MRLILLLFLCSLAGLTTRSSANNEPAQFSTEVDILLESYASQGLEPGGVLCIGSSSMRLWRPRIARDLKPLTVIPAGFGGSHFSDVVRYIEAFLNATSPRAILIYEGDNDANSGKSALSVIRDFLDFRERVAQRDPTIRIYVVSVKPSPARWAVEEEMRTINTLLEQLCQADNQLTFIDVWSDFLDTEGNPEQDLYAEDQLHLTDKGYDRWAKAISRCLLPAELPFEAHTAVENGSKGLVGMEKAGSAAATDASTNRESNNKEGPHGNDKQTQINE